MLNEQAFSSKFRYEYISVKGESAFTTSGGGTNTAMITIPHNLGYVPFFRTYFLFSDIGGYYGGFNGPGLLLGNWEIESINADTADLNISLNNSTSTPTNGTVYYRIYAEPQA